MEWDLNRYYPFKAANKQCLQLATTLLNTYSLTRGCLSTLGTKLQSQLEFGFFSANKDIIQQGESGRDVFLLCTGSIDVLVDDQVVVEIDAPTLVGDKGIVSLNSQRAATIRISGDEEALVIKIPMESFIRNFKDSNISDSQFGQEQSIFENVFQNVQQRLFEYIYLQKSLWEQVTNITNLLNQQLVAKQLDNKRDPGWSDETWNVAKNYLKSKFSITWPEGLPINVENLYSALRTSLDRKYSRLKPEAQKRKIIEWRGMLSGISRRVLESVPEKDKPIPPLDLELFNPNIYRMRLVSMQKQLEKRYATSPKNKEGIKKQPVKVFFGEGDRANEFDLTQYLTYLDKQYLIKNPKRMMAQIAQKCALISADCENDFNISVVKMQQFMDQVKSRNIDLSAGQKTNTIDPNKIKPWVATLARGIEDFRSSSPNIHKMELGKIQFKPDLYPVLSQITKSYRVQFTRDQMNQAFSSLVEELSFKGEFLSNEMLNTLFHLCPFEKGDVVSEEELKKCYWFPMTEDSVVKYGDQTLLELKANALVGNGFIGSPEKRAEETDTSKYSLTTDKSGIMFVLPLGRLPWHHNKSPNPDELAEKYLPIMQWLVNRSFDQLNQQVQHRDHLVQEWTAIRNGIVRSEKIAMFEKKPLKLPKNDHERIISWLNTSFKMKLDPATSKVTSQISTQIYNFFLHTATEEFPGLSIEQRGNQAYTKWRNLLFEIVDQIPALNKVVKSKPGTNPKPSLSELANQLTPLLSPLLKDVWEKRNPITSGTPSLNLLSILHPDKHENSAKAVVLFNNIMSLIAKSLKQLTDEIRQHQATLNKLVEQRDYSEGASADADMQVDMRQESIQQLTEILDKLAPQEV